MARLFFALWPDADARAILAARARQIADRCGGRLVPVRNLHLTLVFLGEIDPARTEALKRAAAEVAGKAFRLGLDCVGGFRRTGVAWTGCRVVPTALLALQAELDRRVREAGFTPDVRAFAPHVTLARRVRDPVQSEDVEEAVWWVESFALVESARAAGTYRTVAEWPLAPEKT